MIYLVETVNPNPRNRFTVPLFIGRVLVLVSIATVLLGPVIGMKRSYARIESMQSPTPNDLVEGHRNALLAIPIGIAIGLVGAALVAGSMIARSRIDKPDPFRPPPSA